MKVKNKETGEIAYALRWNLSAMSELVIGYPQGDMDSDFSKNWVCACHELPLAEGEYGQVLCQKESNND